MSEFKGGDQIVKTSPKIRYAHIRTVIAVTKSGGVVLDYSGYGYKAPRVRHATPQEIAAGHRIDKPIFKSRFSFTSEQAKRIGDRQIERYMEDAETLGDDSPTENHTSPNCKVEDV